ncbi:MAG: hypothetical protein ACRD3W_29785 [Terriglobales bacterium]
MTTALVVTLLGCGRQATAAPDAKASCQAFVQSFYKWYIARGKASPNSDLLTVAMKTRSGDFSPELAKQLKEDLAAAAKTPSEIVGLDFDPILNSQEQEEQYKAVKVTTKGSSFLVEVCSVSGGKTEAQPAVEPELIQSGGKWQFVNFHYNVDKKPDDLLHILKSLRDERKTFKK